MRKFLLPFDRFELYSDQPAGALAERLKAHVTDQKFWIFSKPDQPYQGECSETGFRLRPVTGYQNDFAPVIIGRFESGGYNTRIDVTQRPKAFILVFMTVWFSMVILVGGLLFVIPQSQIEGDGPAWLARVVPLGMLVAGAVMTNGGFWWEARKTRERLSVIFGASAAPVS